MAAIKGKNTKPEMLVRSWLHRNGFRFRLHRKDLPGAPDIVLPKYRTVIFVHGCFWHLHGCESSVVPKIRRDFWLVKLRGNKARDQKAQRELKRLGWQAVVIWECETRRASKAMDKRRVSDLPTALTEHTVSGELIKKVFAEPSLSSVRLAKR